MAAIENENIYGLQIRESANDGSDFTNPGADYRKAFLGEDGFWHTKNSAGTVDAEAAWANFTPTITASGGGFAIGNGTLVGRIRNVGLGLYAVRFYFGDGSTTTEGTGTYTFGGFGITTVAGSLQTLHGVVLDNGTRHYLGAAIFAASANTCTMQVADAGANVGATSPFTFTTGDAIWFQGILEAA